MTAQHAVSSSVRISTQQLLQATFLSLLSDATDTASGGSSSCSTSTYNAQQCISPGKRQSTIPLAQSNGSFATACVVCKPAYAIVRTSPGPAPWTAAVAQSIIKCAVGTIHIQGNVINILPKRSMRNQHMLLTAAA
eukprot:TRINITY_DN1801_c0_g1_i1.p2 TRINITY_DN1801_c0_g1~~TRINITY_DN1801_c0_g1_i1.p2  ORF type:complete len:136 (-),score=30.70 TRINITY_DN1801_c0_g1_i1:2208-2615(-)